MRAPFTQPTALDAPEPRIVRLRADRTAASFDDHAHVHRELGRRLMEHLEPIRISPSTVLDLGCATGALTRDLIALYPRSRVIGLDFALQRLKRQRSRRSRWFHRKPLVCADARNLPLRDRSVDLICANLMLPWVPDPSVLFRECARVLRHGGLIMLSSLGPDTLTELRALVAPDGNPVHSLPDMHHSADQLVASGFSDVVADSESLSADYRGPADLIRELRASGSTYAAAPRAPDLPAARTLANLGASETPDPFKVSYEAVYLHGWYLDRRSVAVQLPASRATKTDHR